MNIYIYILYISLYFITWHDTVITTAKNIIWRKTVTNTSPEVSVPNLIGPQTQTNPVLVVQLLKTTIRPNMKNVIHTFSSVLEHKNKKIPDKCYVESNKYDRYDGVDAWIVEAEVKNQMISNIFNANRRSLDDIDRWLQCVSLKTVPITTSRSIDITQSSVPHSQCDPYES